MGKVHDQIKAVLGAWGEWTTGCPCDCEECVELDRKLADLTNAWGVIQKPIRSSLPSLPKRQRPPVVVREVLKVWKSWAACPVRVQVCNCQYCKTLEPELEKLNQLIEAGPEEEKE